MDRKVFSKKGKFEGRPEKQEDARYAKTQGGEFQTQEQKVQRLGSERRRKN